MALTDIEQTVRINPLDVVERIASLNDWTFERAGDDGLRQLFTSARALPTPNEVDAPGLWLARLEFDSGAS